MGRTRWIRATRHQPSSIRGSLRDVFLRGISVPFAVFHSRRVDPVALEATLAEVLSDFPIFAARTRSKNGHLTIENHNQGAQFSIVERRYPLARALQSLRFGVADLCGAGLRAVVPSPLQPALTVRLSHFSDGTSCLGACWEHGVGDMHSFIAFMHAWSRLLEGQSYERPLLVDDRGAYLSEHEPRNPVARLDLRRFSIVDYARIGAQMTSLPLSVYVYFSEAELANMQARHRAKSDLPLSTSDSLCAHLLELLARHDPRRGRLTPWAIINLRNRTGLPNHVLGNMFGAVQVEVASPYEAQSMAPAIHRAIRDFPHSYMDYRRIRDFVDMCGGPERVVHSSVDPSIRAVSISNIRRFPIGDLSFGAGPPLLALDFTRPTPWWITVLPGFYGRGALANLSLPRAVVDGFRRDPMIHRDRDIAPRYPASLGGLVL